MRLGGNPWEIGVAEPFNAADEKSSKKLNADVHLIHPRCERTDLCLQAEKREDAK